MKKFKNLQTSLYVIMTVGLAYLCCASPEPNLALTSVAWLTEFAVLGITASSAALAKYLDRYTR